MAVDVAPAIFAGRCRIAWRYRQACRRQRRSLAHVAI